MQNAEAIFDQIQALFRRHELGAVVLQDTPGSYMLGSQEVSDRDGYRTAFGGVEIKKRYVSVHFMPIYVHPELLVQLSDALRQRMQGKSCFNFTKINQDTLAELADLIDKGVERFKTDGRLA